MQQQRWGTKPFPFHFSTALRLWIEEEALSIFTTSMQAQLHMLSRSTSAALPRNHFGISSLASHPANHRYLLPIRTHLRSSLNFGAIRLNSVAMTSRLSSCHSSSSGATASVGLDCFELDHFADVGNRIADAAGEVICKYFRKSFDILDKEDLSPVTIADRDAEEAMVKILQENFPSHAIYGEENGWRCIVDFADFVWVLDPIDGTKSFITGKPLFGTLIALLHKGRPILGIIDQPVLRERWVGISGRRTTLNGQEILTRKCSELSKAYLYTTSPHLFSGDAEVAFARVRSKVKVPLYGCDCYAYALLASGFVDLVVESGLKPYDFLALIPVIEGAGGVITDWDGHKLHWEASPKARAASFNVVAAGGKVVHQEALDALQWHYSI